jgi:hypothetical protein
VRSGRSSKGEQRLVEALRALSDAMNAAGAPWMIIGGIAVIVRGVRRLTTDIDAVVRGDAIAIGPLLRVLKRFGVAPRIANAEAFAEENLVLLVRHDPTGVDLDVSFGWTAFEHEAISASTRESFGSARILTARAEDLVIYKAMAARPKDIEDATALILMHPDIDLRRVHRRVAELAELSGDPTLVDGLEDLVQHARSIRRAVKRRTAAKPTAKKKP